MTIKQQQQAKHNRTLAVLPLPSEEVLTPRRIKSAKRHDAELYNIRLSNFRLALSKGHIKIETVREMWLEWYGQYWDDVSGVDEANEPAVPAQS